MLWRCGIPMGFPTDPETNLVNARVFCTGRCCPMVNTYHQTSTGMTRKWQVLGPLVLVFLKLWETAGTFLSSQSKGDAAPRLCNVVRAPGIVPVWKVEVGVSLSLRHLWVLRVCVSNTCCSTCCPGLLGGWSQAVKGSSMRAATWFLEAVGAHSRFLHSQTSQLLTGYKASEVP